MEGRISKPERQHSSCTHTTREGVHSDLLEVYISTDDLLYICSAVCTPPVFQVLGTSSPILSAVDRLRVIREPHLPIDFSHTRQDKIQSGSHVPTVDL